MKKMFVLAMVCAVAFIGCRIHHNYKLKTEWENTREVVAFSINEGDTLYKIAEDHKPDWMDALEYVYAVEELNEMPNASVYAGSTINIYVKGEN